jgi:hypothetical protein
MENYKHDKRIEQTLNSLEGIQRAEANPFLLTRVLEKMKSATVEWVKPVWVWRVAASFVIILMMNIVIGWYTSSGTPPLNNASESGYFSNHMYNY